jgi:6-phosphogluconolactonase
MVETNTNLHGGAIWRAYTSRAELTREVCALLQDALSSAIERDGVAYAALSGGLTPGPIYDRLAQAELEWSKVTLLPTDERLAPLDHAARNDRMIARAFKRGLAEEAQFVSLEDTAAIAAMPAFDVVLLGMGADGHFASIFPHSEGSAEAMNLDTQASAVKVVPDPLPAEAPFVRLTLTLARLINARRVILLITGADKRKIAQDALEPGDRLDPPVRGLFAAAHVEVHWSA